MVVSEKAKTGPHKWELDFCPKCRERTTFWYVDELLARCANCGIEKSKSRGLDMGPGLDTQKD